MSGSRTAIALVALWLCGLTTRAAEDVSPPPAAPALPPFHRAFLPAAEIESRTWKGGYLPVDAKEFERLLETIHAAVADAPRARTTQIEKTEYTMRLDAEDLLVGNALWHLVRRGETTDMLLLDPCTLAIHSGVWQDQKNKPAIVGTGADGRLRVAVEGSQLNSACSLRGERTASGAVSFRLELPGSPIARLSFEAPAGLEVTADQGIVSKTPLDPKTPGAKTNRWTIDLGGHNRVNLVVREDVVRERRPLTLLRQSLEYEFSARGVNVVAQLKVDVHGEPLQRIAVDLDPTLRLATARYGDQDVPWSATIDVETHVSHVVLQLPEPVVGTGRVLQLSAMAPLTSDKAWRLPGIEAEGMSWQEGTATLLIPNAFVLDQLKTEGCRQSRITELPAPLLGESIQVQYYRPAASIEVTLTQRREPLTIDSGTLVELSASEAISRSAAQFSVTRGERHAVVVEVNPDWTIDAIENLDTNRSVDWEPDDLPAEPTKLEIRLDHAITADHPARLLFRGHRRLPTEPAFEAKQLQMLDVDGLQGGRRLIGVRAAEGSELHWSDADDLKTRDTLELTAAETQLFPSQPGSLLFVEDASFSRATVGLERRRPSFSAVIRIDAAVQKQNLTETYTIQCVPAAARVERLLFRFSQSRAVPLEWNLAGGNSGQFSARKLSPGEQAQAGLSAGGEAWEINLRLARPGPFELRAVRTIPLTGETPLALASVADASSQRGSLTIRAIGESGLSITNRRLTSVPAELLEADRYQTARGTYHYQPSRDDLGADAAVSIAPAVATQAESGAWAWSNRLDSRYAVDGTCVHFATYRIQTAGRQQLHVALPEGAELRAAWVDQQRISHSLEAVAADGLLVDLPSGRGFATLSLYYSTPASLPALASSQQPPFPVLAGVPIISRQWSVWLPPGYELADEESAVDGAAPRTWSQRLFGALGRKAGGRIFNPLLGSDWRESFGGAETQAATAAAAQFTSNLAASASDHLNGEEPTWGHLLSLAGEAERQSRRVVLIDAASLAWAGVTPQSHVHVSASGSDAQKGLELLRQHHLVVLVNHGVLLLTTRASAAAHANQLAESEADGVRLVLASSLADEMLAASQQRATSRFESVETWRAAPEREASPWLQLDGAAMNESPGRGWSMATLRLSEQGEPTIHIVRSAAVRSLAWAVFLAVVALGLWSANRHLSILVSFVGLAAAAALLLPAAYAPLASAGFLAGVFCLAVRLIRVAQSPARTSDRSHGSVQRRSTASHPVATLLLAGALVNLGQALIAAEGDVPPPAGAKSEPKTGNAAEKLPAGALPPPALTAPPLTSPPLTSTTSPAPPAAGTAPATAAELPTAPTPSPVYRVLVPVDDHQNLMGGKCFVPEQLYTQLVRGAAAASGQPKGWMITRGFYEGTVSRDPVNRRLGLAQLKASFDLQVFQANVRVRLPLSRDTLASARLEGRAIPLAWNSQGDELVLGPLDAERYRLELDLRPTAQADATTAGFELTIPPLANAALELSMPPDAPAIEVPTARGEVRIQKDRGKLLAQLGANPRLNVRWPIAGGVESAAPNLEVEELLWIKVRPGTTVVDAKFKYRVLSGRVSQIRLLTDPRLRLLPTATTQSVISAVHTIPGDPQKIDLELTRAVSDQVVVDLSFLVTGTSGVGNLRLPRLESSGARAAKRWLAVSVDPALQSRVQAGEDSKQLELPEFAAAWGAGESKPLAAFGVPRGEPMWGLATQPNEPHTSVEQSLAISLGRTSSRVQFDAVLNISGGYLFQIGLQVPAGLVLDRVAMLEDDVQRVARFATDAEGRVTIFLTAPVNGRQQLSLSGRWDLPPAESFAVPKIVVLSGELKKSQVQIYRQPSVLAELETPPGVTRLELPDPKAPDGFGALLGCYAVENPTAAITAKLSPNVLKARAVAATYLQRDGERWMAELEYHTDVSEGLADTLEFEIPAQWSEPYQVEPLMPLRIVPVPGDARRRLVITPPRPVQGKFEMKIRGRVALSAGDRLRVPDIVPLRLEQSERFVVLPSHLDLQQVVWDTMGLSRATLPAELVTRGRNPQSQSVFQVAGEHFQATLNAVKRAGTSSRVALADIHVSWQPDGHCEGVATFDLEQGASNNCVLELPPGFQLLHAAVETLPALAAPLEQNRWRLTLGSSQLPQRVEVVYSGSFDGSLPLRRFAAPRLVDLKVERTLWTVLGPPQFGVPRPIDVPQGTLTASEYSLARLKSLAAVVQLPAETIGEHLPEEIVRWYQPWKQRYESSRAALDWQLTTVRQTSSLPEEMVEARKLDQQVAAAYSRLGLPAGDARRGSLPDAANELTAAARSGTAPAYFAVPGESAALTLSYKTPADGSGPRWLAGLLLVLVGVLAAVVFRRRQLPSLAPDLVIGALGFAWWLLLAPSIVGLIVMLAACWAAFATRWQGPKRSPLA